MAHASPGEYSGEVESRILQEIGRVGSTTLDQLVLALPRYTWNQVFFAVDRLSRHGDLKLIRQPDSSGYLVEVGP